MADANVSSKWLFDLVSEEWGSWLPAEAKQSLGVAGSYSTLVRPGLRVVALNNNYCYHTNVWLMHSTTYYAEELQWLEETLRLAAANNEKVHLISHIPSNERLCFKGWAREYRKIVEFYKDTVVAVFNGHSHEDEFNVYYATEDTSKAINVAFNGGSGTTFPYFNSNYKVYAVNAKHFEVLDSVTWTYNLTEANLHPDRPPKWFKSHSFKEAYNLNDLSPDSLDGLVMRLAKDRDLLRQVPTTYFL